VLARAGASLEDAKVVVAELKVAADKAEINAGISPDSEARRKTVINYSDVYRRLNQTGREEK
jgi:ArsR family metal-binding transcriptional regulator